MRAFDFILQKRFNWCSLFVLISLTLMLLAWKWAFQDLYKQRMSLAVALTAYQQQTSAQESSMSVNNSLQVANDEMSEIRDKLLFQSEARNSAELIPFVVKVLDRISAKHNVKLQGVKPLSPVVVLMLEERPFDITISGNYKNLFAWVKDAEKSLSPMAIKSFKLNAGRTGSDVEMRVIVVSYRLPGEQG